MRSDSRPARLIVALASAAVVALAQLGVPALAGSVRPSLPDVAVGCSFALVGVLVAERRRPLPAVLLLIAAAAWTVSGLAPLIPGVLGEVAARSALLPHALLVATVVLLPRGTRGGPREWILGGAALAVGVFAGTGLLRPAILTLGLIAITSAVRRWRGGVTVAQSALGVVFVLADAGTMSGLLPVASAAASIDLVMVLVLLSLVLLLDGERDLWLAVEVTDRAGADSDAFGARLGRALGATPLRVGFPVGQGTLADFAGREVTLEGENLLDPTGRHLATIAPPPRVDALLAAPLTSVLSRVGAIAALRHAERMRAEELRLSRRLLLRTADEERHDLERRLAHTVLRSVGEVAEEVAHLPGREALLARAVATRDELVRAGENLDVTEPRRLLDVVTAIAESGGSPLDIDIDLLLDLPAPAFRAVWFTCTEALVNAIKHAPGAAIRIEATQGVGTVTLTVADDGPGGVDARGAGLRGLADRASDLGGTLSVSSGPDGSVITLTLPRDFHDVPAMGATIASST